MGVASKGLRPMRCLLVVLFVSVSRIVAGRMFCELLLFSGFRNMRGLLSHLAGAWWRHLLCSQCLCSQCLHLQFRCCDLVPYERNFACRHFLPPMTGYLCAGYPLFLIRFPLRRIFMGKLGNFFVDRGCGERRPILLTTPRCRRRPRRRR